MLALDRRRAPQGRWARLRVIDTIRVSRKLVLRLCSRTACYRHIAPAPGPTRHTTPTSLLKRQTRCGPPRRPRPSVKSRPPQRWRRPWPGTTPRSRQQLHGRPFPKPDQVLGYHPELRLRRRPQTNGVIERFFRSFKEQVEHGRITRPLTTSGLPSAPSSTATTNIAWSQRTTTEVLTTREPPGITARSARQLNS